MSAGRRGRPRRWAHRRGWCSAGGCGVEVGWSSGAGHGLLKHQGVPCLSTLAGPCWTQAAAVSRVQLALSRSALTLCSFWCHSSIQVPLTSLILLRCMMFRISSRTACTRGRGPRGRSGAVPQTGAPLSTRLPQPGNGEQQGPPWPVPPLRLSTLHKLGPAWLPVLQGGAHPPAHCRRGPLW